MFDRVMTNVRASTDLTSVEIIIWLHERYILSPFFIAIVMNELFRTIQDELSWCMLFADYVLLVDESDKC